MTVVKSGGQYQVVIGQQVPDVYEAVCRIGKINPENTSTGAQETDDPKGLMAKFISLVTGVFTPILGLLCAAGMLKGLLAMCAGFGWLAKTEAAICMGTASAMVIQSSTVMCTTDIMTRRH